MDIEYFDREAPSRDVVAALRRDGAVVVRAQLSGCVADAVLAELRPYFDKEGRLTENDFNGYKTLRTSGVLARSRTAAELIGHARAIEIADSYPEPIRRLLGYQSHGRLVGAYQGDPDGHWLAG
jgi:hypothetical protein